MVRPIVLFSLIAAPLAAAQLDDILSGANSIVSEGTNVISSAIGEGVNGADSVLSGATGILSSFASEITDISNSISNGIASATDPAIQSSLQDTLSSLSNNLAGTLSSLASITPTPGSPTSSGANAATTSSPNGAYITGVPLNGALLGLGAAVVAML